MEIDQIKYSNVYHKCLNNLTPANTDYSHLLVIKRCI